MINISLVPLIKIYTMTWPIPISADSPFSLQNIPYGVYSTEADPSPRIGVPVGDDFVLNLRVISQSGCLNCGSTPYLEADSLNPFMEQTADVWKTVRAAILSALGSDMNPFPANALDKSSEVINHLPCTIGDYTDFYSSREHATNVGIMFRGKENALQPNWLHLPVGYHGRASSVYLTGGDVVRPSGQLQKDKDDPKQGSVYGACRLCDFELEMAVFVGGPENAPGSTVSMDGAMDRIFGFVVMNDWSARDIQKWEYVPLGPFGAKNWATTISPWVVTPMALEPFKCATSAGEQTNPVPLDYLKDPEYGSYDINLGVDIQSPAMSEPARVVTSNFKNLYWNVKQQLVHHSVTGCNMRAGDLLGSGTISGQTEDSFGSMLEQCWKGTKEVNVGDETRKFLKDGDTVFMTGLCQKEGYGNVGFGECKARVVPAGTKLVPGKGKGVWLSE